VCISFKEKDSGEIFWWFDENNRTSILMYFLKGDAAIYTNKKVKTGTKGIWGFEKVCCLNA